MPMYHEILISNWRKRRRIYSSSKCQRDNEGESRPDEFFSLDIDGVFLQRISFQVCENRFSYGEITPNSAREKHKYCVRFRANSTKKDSKFRCCLCRLDNCTSTSDNALSLHKWGYKTRFGHCSVFPNTVQ